MGWGVRTATSVPDHVFERGEVKGGKRLLHATKRVVSDWG